MKTLYAVMRMVTAGALMVMAGPADAQQPYPSKPIRFIVPYTPGGAVSAVARIISDKLRESWGQPVIVENRGGANTAIGAEVVAKAAPDGYTILFVTSTHIITPLLFRTPYDPVKDFAAVATISGIEFVLVLHPSVPASNLQEFIALAKSKPGKLNHASTGGGSMSRLAIALFGMMAGVDIQNIPYKGGAPAVTDLLGGQVDLMFANPINVVGFVNSGKLKAIAISGESRSSALPQVPTFTEAGLPRFNVKSWTGVLAPAGTPRAIIDKMSAEIARIVAMPESKEKLVRGGLDPFISTADQFAALMQADVTRFAGIIKVANIERDN